MNNEWLKQLIQKYNDGTCSPEEEALLESWYNHLANRKKAPISANDLERNKQLIWQSVQERMPMQEPLAAIQKPRKKTARIWIAAAAVAAVLLVGYFAFRHTSTIQEPTLTQVEKPAGSLDTSLHQGIVMTLPDGRKVDLKDIKDGVKLDEQGLHYLDGSSILSDEELTASNVHRQAMPITISTPIGENYQVQLPDGTKAWLNASSEITYPLHFNGLKERRIRIRGEVFLEVAKDKTKPFYVQAEDLQVQVLGTAFNVKSYPEEAQQEVTLNEGAIAARVGERAFTLQPNKQLRFHKTHGKVSISTVDADAISSWKTGVYVLDAIELREVPYLIKRWYNVDIEISKKSQQELIISGVIYKNEPVETFLNRLSSTSGIKWQRQGMKIYIK